MTVDAAPVRGLGPAFGRLWGAGTGANLSDGFAATAAPLLAASLTRDPVLISVVGVAQFLPWLLFGVLSGSVVDRFDRRRVAAVACGVRAVVAAAVCALVATDHMVIAVLIGAVFVFGAFETVADGSLQAMVPAVAGRDGLVRANSRFQATEVVAQNFVAAPLAGVLFALAAALPFVAHSAGYVLAAVLVLTLPVSAARPPRGDDEPKEPLTGRSLVEGIRFLLGHPVLSRLWAVNIVLAVFNALAQAVFVLYVLDELGLPDAVYGLFAMAAAVGAVLGALIVPRLVRRFGRGPLMIASVLVTGASYALCGFVPHPAAAAIGMVGAGLSVAGWNVLSVTIRQELVPSRLLGRTHGAWRAFGWGLMPLGTLAGGLLGAVDLRLPFIVGGIGIAAAALGVRRTFSVLSKTH
ncbi:MFS transporter [Jiangella sp. DSM 45060]|uniref:MFS transporter n=1 Tax=Jiangella sp. DSM 45060 TaxID=1798224 RepID=UPI00087A1E26|nr:MFS transporter [Jiangella sp. DSM 45060]SDT54719.1 Major Facilitator Superfamily protein [Jiangella sp. DSM 45060]